MEFIECSLMVLNLRERQESYSKSSVEVRDHLLDMLEFSKESDMCPNLVYVYDERLWPNFLKPVSIKLAKHKQILLNRNWYPTKNL